MADVQAETFLLSKPLQKSKPKSKTMIKHLAPILIARNLDETILYYTEKLGFLVDFVYKEPGIDGYASVYWDHVSIKFREGTPPEDPSCFGGLSIEVENVDAFYEELVERQALPSGYPRQFACIREHPPEDKDYGVRDMFLVDPNGYLLTALTPLPR